jgi:hypothetical protein
MENSFVRWKVLEAPPHAVAKEFVRNAGMQKFGLDRTGINEVVGIFADYEVTEPEGERAL